jgi:hypothetical protein
MQLTSKLHFKNCKLEERVLIISTKLPRVSQIEIVHQEIGMEKIHSHVRRLAQELYFKSLLNDN